MRRTLIAVFFLIVYAGNAASGETPAIQLEPIVVTPSRFETGVTGITSSFSVISGDEINNDNGSVLDILRRQAGVHVSDYYGNSAKASVDLRGFGETAQMNTLVLVDGRRVNSSDLSGVDWYQIPKEVIERIEIMKGSGSVLYGDNAAGGVINIITKKSVKPYSVKLEQRFASYRGFTSLAQAGLLQDNIGIMVNARRDKTDGYRQNSRLKGTDFFGSLRYSMNDNIMCDFDAHYNELDLGFPGAFSEDDLKSRSRRDSKYKDDSLNQEDWYLYAYPQVKINDNILLASGFGMRQKNSTSDWASSNKDTGKTEIETYNITPNMALNIYDKYKVVAGLDYYKDANEARDYARTAGSLTGESDIKKRSTGYYVQAEANPVKPLFVNAGYRYERAEYVFIYKDYQGYYTNVDDKKTMDAQALNAGLSYVFFETNKAYMNFSKSFRLPATDEFLLYDWTIWPAGRFINTALRPQEGYSYTAGLDIAFADIAVVKASGFWMEMKDEIYFDPYLYENRNYDDDTKRKGFETRLDMFINKHISLYASYTFTKANFSGGRFDGNDVPAVPRHIFAAGAGLRLGQFSFNIDCRDTGKSRLISDQDNLKGYLKGYMVVDAGAAFTHKELTLFCKVNNVFNEKYSEYGVRSTMYDTRNYYPAPERNFVAGLKFEF
ncbi:MAG: TonB-dependent receptor [Candidatus Omnitrophica bacterium]|nr:TonB-dependent receptor [Candidatus Omnitrophota bacterium]